MVNNMVLKMPRKESRRGTGINNANIETFKNTPMKSLTKEEEQNSSDGKDKTSLEPVIVEFNDFYINVKDIPDIDKLKEVFKDERKYWNNYLKTDKKAVKFFDKAIESLDKNVIRCLRISDKNTTGLLGVEKEYSSQWNNLVINTEISDKPGADGGSYGIGKDAAFANTHLRLVFYNTINKDGEKAFQGVLKLPSYSKGNNNYEGFGFFSKNTDDMEINPIRENISLDPSYTRTEVGMDKYIIGFGEDLDTNDLKEQIIVSSIDNFLYAFKEGSLVVKYGDLIVDVEHIDEIIENYREQLDNRTLDYYETLCNPDRVIDISVINENDVKAYIKLGSDYCRRAAIVRGNGMKVFDMDRISGRIGFAAIIVLKDESINEYFKKLENPEHDKWAFDRAENVSEAKRYQRKMKNPVQASITEMHRDSLGEEIDADGMNEYLPYAYTHGKKQKREGLSNEVDNLKRAKKRKKTKKDENAENITYQEDEMGNIDENTIDINTDSENNGGGGKNPYGGESRQIDSEGNDLISLTENKDGKFVSKGVIDKSKFRFKYNHNNNTHSLTMFSKKKVEKGFLEVFISGETTNVPIKVMRAIVNGVDVETRSNKIFISNVDENSRLDILFDVKNEGDWALEVVVHES
ncbi:MAG: hypothetical protein HFG31_04460 [Eubacterium sp.]|nr:hypothetical protein [Eubacterium sp.]